jgi:hypothetical protein
LPFSKYIQEINCQKINAEINNKIINHYQKLLINKKSIKISKSHSIKMHEKCKKYIG